jgi:adenylosuccinate synthase
MDNELKKKIARDFGLGSMNSEEQERMIEKIGNLLFEAVVEKSVDEMDEEALNDFDQVIDSAGNDYQKIISFFKDRVPKFNEIVTEEMSRLKRATSGIFA